LPQSVFARVGHRSRGALHLGVGTFMRARFGEILAAPLVNRGAAAVDAAILPVLLPAAASLGRGDLEIFGLADVGNRIGYVLENYVGQTALNRHVLLNIFRRHVVISPLAVPYGPRLALGV